MNGRKKPSTSESRIEILERGRSKQNVGIESKRGRREAGPFYLGKRRAEAASASVSVCPGFERGAAISANHFGVFAFFFFFAM
jgi:hypothetical protein